MIPDELLRSFAGEEEDGENGAAGAEEETAFPQKVSLAMGYVPYQRFENLYDESKALTRGTLFACLDLPFYGGGRGRD
ncbi:MAG: spore coat associated protein CotJA [Clostridia bacterium]|nr:spore coat associated protein CotJA [Clostridia bacterium]